MTFDYEFEELWREDPLAADCINGGLGCYVLLDSLCEFNCPWRESCRKIQKRSQLERQGEVWRRQFRMENSESFVYPLEIAAWLSKRARMSEQGEIWRRLFRMKTE